MYNIKRYKNVMEIDRVKNNKRKENLSHEFDCLLMPGKATSGKIQLLSTELLVKGIHGNPQTTIAVAKTKCCSPNTIPKENIDTIY